MKMIKTDLCERHIWVEETRTVILKGYDWNERKAAEKEIIEMLAFNNAEIEEIGFTWHSDEICIVEFKYEMRVKK
jgi:hypothetical protein